jgi:hypothetical protein
MIKSASAYNKIINFLIYGVAFPSAIMEVIFWGSIIPVMLFMLSLALIIVAADTFRCPECGNRPAIYYKKGFKNPKFFVPGRCSSCGHNLNAIKPEPDN